MAPMLLHLLFIALMLNSVAFAIPAPAVAPGRDTSPDAPAFKAPPPVAERIAALASGGNGASSIAKGTGETIGNAKATGSVLDDAAGAAKPDGTLNGKLSQEQDHVGTFRNTRRSEQVDPKVCSNYTALTLLAHNVHRANHSAPALVWNNTLASHAKSWASKCTFSHADPENLKTAAAGYGQNLAVGNGIDIAKAVAGLWYNGEAPVFQSLGLFDLLKGGDEDIMGKKFEKWGHFSQVVWKGTKSVGCATVECPTMKGQGLEQMKGAKFTVCDYYPAGNLKGSFGKNVGLPDKAKPVSNNGVCSLK
ncbi:MAG: hypothetical protein M1831_005495 [Alyxoria varia]|nr:MAG: hypothetical protein M1831_005495 [Alyxoria varia]